MPLTTEDIEQIAKRTAEEVMDRVYGVPELAFHVAEHQATGGALVVDEAKARVTPCKGFTFEGETYAWSPGCVGLISSKKNPEQLKDFCALGIEPAGAGAEERFKQLKGAIGEAHKEWEEKEGNLKEWWEAVGQSLGKRELEL